MRFNYPYAGYNCAYCVHDSECDLEQRKDHAYNLRDGTKDCFELDVGKQIPPWSDPMTECYGCMQHSYEDCGKCHK